MSYTSSLRSRILRGEERWSPFGLTSQLGEFSEASQLTVGRRVSVTFRVNRPELRKTLRLFPPALSARAEQRRAGHGRSWISQRKGSSHSQTWCGNSSSVKLRRANPT